MFYYQTRKNCCFIKIANMIGVYTTLSYKIASLYYYCLQCRRSMPRRYSNLAKAAIADIH